MFVEVLGREQSFVHRVYDCLQETDYRLAHTDWEKEAIYRLRYRAYLREGAIHPNTQLRFTDAYDRLENCWIFGVHMAGRLVGSIRLHVISPENPMGPALDVFPDIVGPMIDAGQVVVDPTRFVADAEISRRTPELPYLTLRLICLAAEHFEADYCLATVRKEHRAFYRRVFGSKPLCEPRPYPTLKDPICLMRGSVAELREQVLQRRPFFQSTFTERRMMFERRPDQGVNREPARVVPMLARSA